MILLTQQQVRDIRRDLADGQSNRVVLARVREFSRRNTGEYPMLVETVYYCRERFGMYAPLTVETL